jgi:hypothetical protein
MPWDTVIAFGPFRLNLGLRLLYSHCEATGPRLDAPMRIPTDRWVSRSSRRGPRSRPAVSTRRVRNPTVAGRACTATPTNAAPVPPEEISEAPPTLPSDDGRAPLRAIIMPNRCGPRMGQG